MVRFLFEILLGYVITGGHDKELEQPSSASVKRKHLYGLGVSGDHGNTVERNDWWDVMFYLRKLDPSQFQRILTMLPSYSIKVMNYNFYKY